MQTIAKCENSAKLCKMSNISPTGLGWPGSYCLKFETITQSPSEKVLEMLARLKIWQKVFSKGEKGAKLSPKMATESVDSNTWLVLRPYWRVDGPLMNFKRPQFCAKKLSHKTLVDPVLELIWSQSWVLHKLFVPAPVHCFCTEEWPPLQYSI